MNYKENKQVLLTFFITMIMMATTIFTFSQTTINPDTICVNATGEIHFVTNTPTSTYQWTITGGGGAITGGQGTNSITTDWGAVSGLYPNAVSVIETNSNNCPGAPVNLDVYLLQMGLSTLGPFCTGDPAAALGGSPAGGTYSGTGVVGNQFDPVTAGLGVHVVTYTLAGCSTTINVTVNTGPVTGPIQHY